MIEIMVDLQGGAKAPLYEKIYEYIREEMIDGKLSQGERLPSTRLLAKNLGVSRSTVELAYEQLLAEGYIKAEPCRGFFTCDITQLYQLGEKKALQKENDGEPEETVWKVDFSPYDVDTENFPYNIWRRLSKNALLDDNENLLLSGNNQGEYELRQAIARYLHQARGVNCSASDIIIGAGNEYLEILLTQILGRQQRVLMENPGYPQAYHTFCNMGYQVKMVAAGTELSGDELQDVDFIYMMPSHQFPLGTVMPLGQRLELLRWAQEKENRYLIEDDHDSEYRYRGKPIPSMQSIDRTGKVIYLGTFSKSIAPSLRISYMVLPPGLMAQYHRKCGFYSNTVPKIQQEILRAFIQDGYFERHLNKMRGIYKSRHDFLLGELRQCSWVKGISGEHAGLHLLVEVDTCMTEEMLCAKAGEAGVKVSGIGAYMLTDDEETSGENTQRHYPVLVLGYGKAGEQEIQEGLHVLEKILRNSKK